MQSCLRLFSQSRCCFLKSWPQVASVGPPQINLFSIWVPWACILGNLGSKNTCPGSLCLLTPLRTLIFALISGSKKYISGNLMSWHSFWVIWRSSNKCPGDLCFQASGHFISGSENISLGSVVSRDMFFDTHFGVNK